MPRRPQMSTMARSSISLLVVLVLSACSESSGPPRPTTGTVSANITDAPLPIDSVSRVDVWIVRLDATMRDATDNDIRNAGTPASGNPRTGWVTVAAPDSSYNLVALRNGAKSPLGTGDLEIGIYRSFRLVLDADRSTVTLKDGRVLTSTSSPGIRWPSAGRSGVKVDLKGMFVLTRDGAPLLIDFNLEESFVLAGSSLSTGGLIFNPVLRGEQK